MRTTGTAEDVGAGFAAGVDECGGRSGGGPALPAGAPPGAGGDARAVVPAPARCGRHVPDLLPPPFTVALPRPPVLEPESTTGEADRYVLVAQQADVELLPGVLTPMLTLGGTFPAPTIVARPGRPVELLVHNLLPVPVSLHLHGAITPAASDGHPDALIQPGDERTYSYPLQQGPATLWFHDHRAHHTGEQVYRGLAGAFLVVDKAEAQLGLPAGDASDVLVLLGDKQFAADGSLVYGTGSHGGFLGDVTLVNGAVAPIGAVPPGRVRLRLVNAANARRSTSRAPTGRRCGRSRVTWASWTHRPSASADAVAGRARRGRRRPGARAGAGPHRPGRLGPAARRAAAGGRRGPGGRPGPAAGALPGPAAAARADVHARCHAVAGGQRALVAQRGRLRRRRHRRPAAPGWRHALALPQQHTDGPSDASAPHAVPGAVAPAAGGCAGRGARVRARLEGHPGRRRGRGRRGECRPPRCSPAARARRRGLHRQLHLPLPHPRARGPRHDARGAGHRSAPAGRQSRVRRRPRRHRQRPSRRVPPWPWSPQAHASPTRWPGVLPPWPSAARCCWSTPRACPRPRPPSWTGWGSPTSSCWAARRPSRRPSSRSSHGDPRRRARRGRGPLRDRRRGRGTDPPRQRPGRARGLRHGVPRCAVRRRGGRSGGRAPAPHRPRPAADRHRGGP